MAKFTQTYPTDLQYTEWQQIERHLTLRMRGRPRNWEMSLIINAVLYVAGTGCQWPLRVLPTNLPPWQTVWFSR